MMAFLILLPNWATELKKSCLKILVYKYHSPCFGKPIVVSQFGFEVGESSFQTIVGIGYAKVLIITPNPQVRHIAFDTQIRTSQSLMNVPAFARFLLNITLF